MEPTPPVLSEIPPHDRSLFSDLSLGSCRTVSGSGVHLIHYYREVPKARARTTRKRSMRKLGTAAARSLQKRSRARGAQDLRSPFSHFHSQRRGKCHELSIQGILYQ